MALTTKRKLIQNISLLVVTLAVLFLIGEIALRFLSPYEVDEENLEHSMEMRVDIPLKRNKLGLRDKDYDFEHDNYRILALGDSFTFGRGLKPSGTWPKLTEAELRRAGMEDVEVLNAGHDGASTESEYDYYVKTASKYNPDLVLVAFLINDCTIFCSNCGPVYLKKEFDRLASPPEGGKIFYSSIIRHVKLLKIKLRLTGLTVAMYTVPYKEELPEFKRCTGAFKSFKRLSEKEGFDLVVIIYPMLYELKKEYPFQEINDIMMDVFKDLDIEAYDLTPAFIGLDHNSLWLHPYDAHPNRKANTIAAGELARVIRARLDKGGSN